MPQQRHEKILSILGFRIFNKKLKPGSKLPPERELTKELDVDRTSLRVALKQLEALNVLDIKQGDGIYVKDYMKHAGLDFLRILFQLTLDKTDADKKNQIIDEFIIDEILEFWLEFLPTLLRMVSEKFSNRVVKELIELYDQELVHIDDKQHVVDIEIMAQDLIVQTADNLFFTLIMNSCRLLRKKMFEMFITSFDKDTIVNDIELRKALLSITFSGSKQDILSAIENYKEHLKSFRQNVRETWASFQDSKEIMKRINI